MASGSIEQEIEILEPSISIDDLLKGLNNGTFSTTINDNGYIEETESGKKIAKINGLTNDLEYDDFIMN